MRRGARSTRARTNPKISGTACTSSRMTGVCTSSRKPCGSARTRATMSGSSSRTYPACGKRRRSIQVLQHGGAPSAPRRESGWRPCAALAPAVSVRVAYETSKVTSYISQYVRHAQHARDGAPVPLTCTSGSRGTGTVIAGGGPGDGRRPSCGEPAVRRARRAPRSRRPAVVPRPLRRRRGRWRVRGRRRLRWRCRPGLRC
jgi:hypothetical protein